LYSKGNSLKCHRQLTIQLILSFEAQRQLKGLCDEPIDLPIPRLYELLQFQYNDNYFNTRVNTEAELEEEIM